MSSFAGPPAVTSGPAGWEPQKRNLGVVTMAASYPVQVAASLDRPLSRWLWLVKWVLVIPHYIVLAFLWLAFVLLSAVAMAAIVITGRYPPAIFDFNVGVLRWTWRVQYYAIGAFGTDRYPPFTLADDPSYPARLDIRYPAHLSRGLALVKWWLLAIPHYIVIGVFTGGAAWFASRSGAGNLPWGGTGLIGILALIAAVVLLVTGRYPEQIFDFVLGMNRWVLRVAAYAGLMTDEYPPFRLDMGGPEPGGTLSLPGPCPARPASPRQVPRRAGWTPARIVSAIIGAVLVLCSLGLLGGGGVALWAQTTQRHNGYVDLGTATYRTGGYAIASDAVELHFASGTWDTATALFGKIRIRVSGVGGATPVFVGIAPAAAAARYLSGVSYASVTGIADNAPAYASHSGGAPAVLPGRAGIWTARVAGPGPQTLTWTVKSGSWMIVAMNVDGSRPVSVRVTAAATLPALPWLAAGLLIGGFIVLAGGIVLIAIPVERASRREPTAAQEWQPPQDAGEADVR
jgi:hypothetical protein